MALFALQEQLRPDARETLDRLAKAGVRLKLISGDNPQTVAALTRQIGLVLEGPPMSGLDLESLDDAGLADAVGRATIFGRVPPSLKARLVEALRGAGYWVAMVGDGVNDVLSLKQAHLGISMQSGSQATRAVADMVLLEDSFSALPTAVVEGQRIISGMQDSLHLFLARAMYMSLVILGAALLGLAIPVSPRHNTVLGLLTVGVPALVPGLLGSSRAAGSRFAAPHPAPHHPAGRRVRRHRRSALRVLLGQFERRGGPNRIHDVRHVLRPGAPAAARAADRRVDVGRRCRRSRHPTDVADDWRCWLSTPVSSSSSRSATSSSWCPWPGRTSPLIAALAVAWAVVGDGALARRGSWTGSGRCFSPPQRLMLLRGRDVPACSSASASATWARTRSRSRSRPADTSLAVLPIASQLRLEIADEVELGANGGHGLQQPCRVELGLLLGQRSDGVQPRQTQRRQERVRVRGLRVDDAQHVPGTHVERGDAGRRMDGREHRHRDGGAAISFGVRKLVANLAPRDGPVLGLDDHAQLATAAELRVHGQHEIALLGAHDVAARRTGSFDGVSGAADRFAE